MSTLATIITIGLLVVSVLLIIVVLLQKTKTAGMGGAFASDTQSFTSKGRAASREAKLQKLTVILAVILGVFATVLTIVR